MVKRRLDLTPGFPAFLAAVWYFDSCGIFWPFLAAMTVHELAHAAVLLLLGGRIESVRLSFAQVELRTGLLSDRTELWSTAASMLICFPNMPFLQLLKKALVGEIASKLNVKPEDVEAALDKMKKK